MKHRPTRRRAILLCFLVSTLSALVHSTVMRLMDVREAFLTALRAPDHPSSGRRGPCPTPSSFKREATAHRAIHPSGGLWRRCSRRRGYQWNKSTVGWIVLTWQRDPATDACQHRDSSLATFRTGGEVPPGFWTVILFTYPSLLTTPLDLLVVGQPERHSIFISLCLRSRFKILFHFCRIASQSLANTMSAVVAAPPASTEDVALEVKKAPKVSFPGHSAGYL